MKQKIGAVPRPLRIAQRMPLVSAIAPALICNPSAFLRHQAGNNA
jgi:hypothetical protein